jgi:hypothetical protein
VLSAGSGAMPRTSNVQIEGDFTVSGEIARGTSGTA